MKLAQLENQAIIRQCEYEKANGIKYEQKNYERKSPKKRENYHQQILKTKNDDNVKQNQLTNNMSYIDMSYSQSPSPLQ